MGMNSPFTLSPQTFARTWFVQQKSLVLAELTVSYETSLRQQQERKEEKYKELVTGMRLNSSLWKLAPEE